jgi:hypothetical protein
VNSYKIRIIQDENWLKCFKEGVLKIDAKLWKDEYIYETDLSFEEVMMIPCVIAVENLLQDKI